MNNENNNTIMFKYDKSVIDHLNEGCFYSEGLAPYQKAYILKLDIVELKDVENEKVFIPLYFTDNLNIQLKRTLLSFLFNTVNYNYNIDVSDYVDGAITHYFQNFHQLNNEEMTKMTNLSNKAMMLSSNLKKILDEMEFYHNLTKKEKFKNE